MSENKQKFYEEQFIKLKDIKLIELKDFYKNNIKGIAKGFVDVIEEAVSEIPDAKYLDNILTIQLQRTSLFLDGRGEYLLELFDDAKYEKLPGLRRIYNADWAFKPFLDLEKELEPSRKQIIGKVKKFQVWEMMLNHIFDFSDIVLLMARQIFVSMDKDKLLKIMRSVPAIVMGDYVEPCDNIKDLELSYVIRMPPANADICKWIKRYGAESCIFYKVDFEEEMFINQDFSFSRFCDVTLTGKTFSQCDFTGCVISNCDISETKFALSVIAGAKFMDCDFKDVSFDFSKIRGGFSDILGGTVFKNCSLSNVSFKHVDKRKLSFINTDKYNVLFDDGLINSAAFSEE